MHFFKKEKEKEKEREEEKRKERLNKKGTFHTDKSIFFDKMLNNKRFLAFKFTVIP